MMLAPKGVNSTQRVVRRNTLTRSSSSKSEIAFEIVGCDTPNSRAEVLKQPVLATDFMYRSCTSLISRSLNATVAFSRDEQF
jgi:hypothetical protein